MNFFHHKQLMSFMLIVFLFILLILIWRAFPIVNLTEIYGLWTNSDNRTGIIINLVSSGIWVVIVLLLSFFRRILHILKAFILPGRTETDLKLIEQEQLYLDNFIERYKGDLPWEIEKYTALEALQEVRRVQTRLYSIPDSKELHTEENMGSRVDILSFLRHEKGPIMLKGDPGAGKTLTLRRFAVDQARNSKTALGEEKIPVYILLSFYTGKTPEGEPEPVLDFLQRYLQEEFPFANFLRENLADYLTRGRLLLLFDGLNELPSHKYSLRSSMLEEFVRRDFPKNKAIFTCRTLPYTSDTKFKTVAISDLNKDQIKRFITAYLGAKAAEDAYRELTTGDGFMLRICRNPFMLHMLVNRKATQVIPQTPALLFEQYIQGRLSPVQAIISATGVQTADVLREVAFTMQRDGKFAGVVSLEWLKTQLPHLSLDEHLRAAHQAELIAYTQENKIRFYHQILQEYFAALALQNEWLLGKSIEEYFTDYRWEETILVCAGITKDPETFISKIWSSGKSSPEAFLLATKAVGSSVVNVSANYLENILKEAEEILNPEKTSTAGYSKIVLEVDTIKALTYIDNNNAVKLLSSTLVKHVGWVREVCIQALGNSRNQTARPLLHAALVDLRSFPTLLLASPYFSKREWLGMAASSTISIPLVTTLFWQSIRFLWILAPGVYIGVLLLTSDLFKIDPFVLLGRALSLTLFVLMVNRNIGIFFSLIRSIDHLTVKLKSFKNILLSESIMIISVITLWLFPDETQLLFAIAYRVFIYLLIVGQFLTLLINIRNPIRLTNLLYSIRARVQILAVFLIALGLISLNLFPNAWHIPSNLHIVSSPVENFLGLIDSFLWYPILLYILIGMVVLIGIASIIVHFITFVKYLQIRQYRRAFTQKGDIQALQHIIKIAVKHSEWLHIRKKVFKDLRLIDIPVQYIGELDDLIKYEESNDALGYSFLMIVFGNHLDLQTELERTVYDLLSRTREEERETPDEKYLAALVNQALSRSKKGYYQEAIGFLNKALTLNSKFVSALEARGEIYLFTQHYVEAIVDLTQAISLDGKNARVLANRGATYLFIQRYSEALNDFNQAILLDKNYSWALARRGETYRVMECYMEAIVDLTQAISLDGKDMWALASRGATYLSMKRYSEALIDLDRAITFNEKYVWVLANRGEVYRLMKRYSEALNDFNQAILLDKNYSWALARRGETYRAMKCYVEAITDLTQAISLDEKEHWFRYSRACTYCLIQATKAFRRDITHAIDLAQSKLLSDPGNHDVAFNLALYRIVAGHASEGELDYDHLMSTCLSLTKLQRAEDDLVDFLNIQPTHKLARSIHTTLQKCIGKLMQESN